MSFLFFISVTKCINHAETDSDVYDPESYIFFRQCLENTVNHDTQKGTPDEDKLYLLTFQGTGNMAYHCFFSPAGENAKCFLMYRHLIQMVSIRALQRSQNKNFFD